MINHDSSIYILCDSDGGKLLKYNKTTDELSSLYIFSSDLYIYDIGDLYNNADSNHLLFVGSSNSNLSAYIGITISSRPDMHKDIRFEDNNQL